MKPMLQKLPLNETMSFIADTFVTPHFEVGWHQHAECELILFKKGMGVSFIGDHVGDFNPGDVFLLGGHLPHMFQKRFADLVGAAVVVLFEHGFWGKAFLELPESRPVKTLLELAAQGLKIHGRTQRRLTPLIDALQRTKGFRRVLMLAECLEIIASGQEFTELSTQRTKVFDVRETACIDGILRFTLENFREPICLQDVATLACMSISSFCNYFKKTTQKTYIDFLNEVRIGHACTLLIETDKSVLEVCYESGFRTSANFYKQFGRVKGSTPQQYRRMFTNLKVMNVGGKH